MFDISAITFADILPFIAIGFAAQLIDGALGMAFGVISQTLLISIGVPPAAASASVHLVEVFTTGASGASHMIHRNVDWGLFRRLVPFGVAGGVAGAYLLSNIDAAVAKPFVRKDHWTHLSERRTAAELERLLAKRLALLRAGKLHLGRPDG